MSNELTSKYKAEFEEIIAIIEQKRENALCAVNAEMLLMYWELGKYISKAIGDRADYGKYLLKYLSERLTKDFGEGFTVRNLRNMRQFYQMFSIRNSLRAELSWTHYRTLMRIDDETKRHYYLRECAENAWNTRELERQINSFHYERLLAVPTEEKADNRVVHDEKDPSYILKDPYILEFLDLKENK